VAVVSGGRAPYAPTKAVLAVVERHRQVGLKALDVQRLQNIGITEALAPRTMQALVLLDFYDDAGGVTPGFDALRKVPEHDFRPRLAALLRNAYADVLQLLDPTAASVLDVENAFRGFEPTGQLPRMVQLFTGLMAFVGIMPEGAARKPSGPRPATSKPKSTRQAPLPPTPEPVATALATNPQDGHHTTVDLGPGGQVTLIVNVNPLAMSRADRDIFYSVVDKITDWQHASNGSTTK
jgi:hypothetical protein